MFPIVFYSKKGRKTNATVSEYVKTEIKETSFRPIYYFTKNMIFQGKSWKALYLCLFWTENPGYNICCYNVGYHEADVERVIILIDENNKSHWVYFGAHSNIEGVWKKWTDCEKDDHGRLKVYISPQSQGMYPEKKLYWRIFGFTNEMCNCCNEEWIPEENDFCNVDDQSWVTSHPNLGKNNEIGNPKNVEDPRNSSLTSFQRFFLPLPCIMKKLNKEHQVMIL